MEIKTFIDNLNATNIYIVYDKIKKNCVIIDPSNYKLIDDFIKHNELDIDYILLTHEHFDHILGVNELINKYNCSLVASEQCNSRIVNSKTNLSSFSEVLLYFRNNCKQRSISIDNEVKSYSCKPADITFVGDLTLFWNNHRIYICETPGHSKGSVSVVFNNKIVFSGDSLLKDLDVITRFPGGSAKEYNSITLPFYESLSKNMIVYPGHGESFVMREKLCVEVKIYE